MDKGKGIASTETIVPAVNAPMEKGKGLATSESSVATTKENYDKDCKTCQRSIVIVDALDPPPERHTHIIITDTPTPIRCLGQLRGGKFYRRRRNVGRGRVGEARVGPTYRVRSLRREVQ